MIKVHIYRDDYNALVNPKDISSIVDYNDYRMINFISNAYSLKVVDSLESISSKL